MNNLFTKFFYSKICERGLAISSFIFPLFEISYSFGSKVFSGTDSIIVNYFYLNYIVKLNNIYAGNVYLIFVVMVGIFMICSRGTLALTRFLRFNVIQAILLNVICSCVGASYIYFPVSIRETIFGNLIANCMFFGPVIISLYSILLISFGRYPKIPVLSDAAKLQVQRGSGM